MIGYVPLGTRELAYASQFYDAIAAEPGTPEGGAGIGAGYPYDGNAMSVGNGVVVALQAKDKAQVDRIYHLALSMGATDEGPPGPRGDTFYAGYFREPDGNKLNAFVMG